MTNDVIKESFDGKKIFYFDKKYEKILKKILNSDYIIEEEYKNDSRTYVAKIKIDSKNYILKKIYTTKKIKKILSFFKKGEALSTLLNINKAIENGVSELAKPLGAIVERKKGFIINEMFLMEYCDGRRINGEEEYLRTLKILDKIYSLGRFHGDCNPANFYYVDEKIVILDTKLKKMIFGNYRKHYDILTLMKYIKIEYPYKKNIFYYFAYLVRKMRDKKRERNE